MGRDIQDGLRVVNIWGNEIQIRAQVKEIKTMSSHADQGQLLEWLRKINGLKEVVLIHGEELARLVISEKIRQEFPGIKIELPMVFQEIELKA
jgi:metallo-beta-lactamase family protein